MPQNPGHDMALSNFADLHHIALNHEIDEVSEPAVTTSACGSGQREWKPAGEDESLVVLTSRCRSRPGHQCGWIGHELIQRRLLPSDQLSLRQRPHSDYMCPTG